MFRMFLLVFGGLTLTAQTQIDLRTQAKHIDFTAADSTRPIKTGTALPATCVQGDMFFKTDAPAGANLYGCTAANTWSVQGGISSANCQYDAASGTLRCTDARGNVYATVETATNGTPNQWVDYIAPTGIPHTSQPTAAAVGAVADPGSNGIPYRNGSGTAAPASANEMSGPSFCQDAGAGNGYACNLNPPISSYKTGTSYWFKAGAANTGAATINFNALGPGYGAERRLHDGAGNGEREPILHERAGASGASRRRSDYVQQFQRRDGLPGLRDDGDHGGYGSQWKLPAPERGGGAGPPRGEHAADGPAIPGLERRRGPVGAKDAAGRAGYLDVWTYGYDHRPKRGLCILPDS